MKLNWPDYTIETTHLTVNLGIGDSGGKLLKLGNYFMLSLYLAYVGYHFVLIIQ